MSDTKTNGSCLCGGVAFTATNIRPTATLCHCTQCRKWSGHHWAATRADTANIHFTNTNSLRWFTSSDHARRGFCHLCGSSLFYQPNGADHIGIAAGCLDAPTGMTPGKHIFCASKGDYYDIAGDAPHIPD